MVLLTGADACSQRAVPFRARARRHGREREATLCDRGPRSVNHLCVSQEVNLVLLQHRRPKMRFSTVSQ